MFSLGLILVVVGGAELFTGNVLLAMGWADRKISTAALLRNWTIVYLGNFAGAIGNLDFTAAELGEIDRISAEGDINLCARSSQA